MITEIIEKINATSIANEDQYIDEKIRHALLEDACDFTKIKELLKRIDFSNYEEQREFYDNLYTLLQQYIEVNNACIGKFGITYGTTSPLICEVLNDIALDIDQLEINSFFNSLALKCLNYELREMQAAIDLEYFIVTQIREIELNELKKTYSEDDINIEMDVTEGSVTKTVLINAKNQQYFLMG